MIDGGDLHLPVGKPVKVLLRSIDVLHDFYVPEFRAKMDMVPGMVTYFWFTPTRTGTFEALCAEFCGVGHSAMRGRGRGRAEPDYQTWLRAAADLRVSSRAAPGGLAAKARSLAAAERTGPAREEASDGRRRNSAAADLLPQPIDDVELYHPHSWITKYVFSQDAKIIAVQYSLTALAIGLVALVLSWLMRLQLGFPGTLRLHRPERLLPLHHHARHDHGGLSADRPVPRRLRQLPHPAHGRRAGHGVPVCQHAELLDLPPGRAGPRRELLRAGRPDRGRLDPLSAAGDPLRHAGPATGASS